VPGGRLSKGIRRVDWLGKDTVFGGIVRNDAFVASDYAGFPAIFELKYEMRYQLTKREVAGQLERERESARSRAAERESMRS
jgi:hypothetical protein